MDRTLYDTKAGIEMQLRSNGGVPTYEALYALIEARRTAPEAKEGRLGEFWVLGRYFLDIGGNATLMRGEKSAEDTTDTLPIVMTDQVRIAQASAQSNDYRMSGTPGEIRPPHVNCGRCGKGWTFADSHRVVSSTDANDQEEVDLSDHAGKTLAQLQRELDAKTDGQYVFYAQNLGNLDNIAKHESEGTGSRREDRYIPFPTDDHVIVPRDYIVFSVTRYYHDACHAQVEADAMLEQRAAMSEWYKASIVAAGFQDVQVVPAPAPVALLTVMANGLVDEDIGPCTGEESAEQSADQDAERRAALEALGRELAYFSVITKEGCFGLLELPMAMFVDLEGTGLVSADFGPENAAFVSQLGFTQPLYCISEDESALLRLWQALAKRKLP